MKTLLLKEITNAVSAQVTKLSFYLIFFLPIFAGSQYAQAQTWTEVGGGSAAGGVIISYISLAIDNNGTPYVAFQDDTNNHEKASVMKYNGAAWVAVGSPAFSAGTAYYTTLAINGSGTPYLAYSDGSNGYKAIVMKYNGSSWVTVGPAAGFSASQANYTSLAVDGNETPYVAYEDNSVNNKITVMKYNGTNWLTVGNPGFSDSVAYNPHIAIDGSGNPYVAYCDYANGKKATVKKFDGSNWVTVGNTGFSNFLSAGMLSFAVDANGVPYIGYSDQGNGGKAAVMQFDGTNWVSLGSTSLSCGFGAMGLDKNGTPYEIGDTIGSLNKFTVNKFDGTNWVSIGTVSGSSSTGAFSSFCMAASDSSIFVADGYAPAPSLTSTIWAEVRKQSLNLLVNPINAVKNKLDVYPNPGNGTFKIYYAAPGITEVQMVLTNMLGQTLKTFKAKTNTAVDVDMREPDGVYFLTAITPNGRDDVKIVMGK